MGRPKEKMRILLTEQCNANCAGCFNKNIRSGLDMDMEDYAELVDYLSGNGIRHIKVMGGEPTVHPHFEEAIERAQDKFQGVFIFTNALNEKIMNIRLRETDSVIYNFSFVDQTFDLDKMLMQYPGNRVFEVQISSGACVEDLTSRLGYIFRKIRDDRIKISLTLDCMEDIFLYRDLVITKWNDVVNFILKDLHKLYYFDHSIPWCFFEKTPMKIRPEIRQCNTHCAGLITADLWLQHCNQYQEKGVCLKDDKGFIPYDRLLHSLQEMNDAKIKTNREKACSGCRNFLTQCNGGCFIHKDFINPAGIAVKGSLV